LARRGTFGSKLTPFGGGDTDLSVYRIGPAAQPTYSVLKPPPAPTVAPATGVLPQPVLPKPALPSIYLKPDISEPPAYRKAPFGTQTNTTWAAKARLLPELLAAGG